MSIHDHEKSSVQPLKPLPYEVTKKELQFLYPKETRRRLSYWANEVMTENRKQKKKKISRCRNLFHKEWEMLIEILGYPEGYEKFFRG